MSSNIRVQRNCQHCGKDFEAQKTTTKFCSLQCGSRAYKANVKALKVELSNKETEQLKAKPIEHLNAKEFLTITETCQLLSVSRWTIWRTIKSNKLSVGKLGRRTLIKRTQLDQLFNQPSEMISKIEAKPEPIKYEIANCYSTEEVRFKFGISESTLRSLIIKNKIPKFRQGWFAYVPKTIIDDLLNSFTIK